MRNRFLPAGPAGAGWRRARRRLTSSAAPAVVQALEERRLLDATLVSDVNTGPSITYRPTNITESGGVAYVGLNDGQSGPELWRSDGTAGGTWLVKDIREGPAGSFPGATTNSFVDAGGTLYFAADGGGSGFELWKSDGTEEGTVQVADLSPGASGSAPTQLLAVGSGVYFFADDGVHGRELWHSDGTPEGTALVKDVRPGATGQLGKAMAALPNGMVFFYATDGAGHSGLWRTDGTPGGTIYLKGSAENFVTSSGPMVASGGWMYIPDAVGGLWRSDGTPAGTTEVERGDSLTGYVTEMADVNGTLFYVRGISSSTDRSGDLWARSGDNTRKIAGPGGASLTHAQNLVNVNGTLYFAGTTSAAGSEPFRIRPADLNATLVADVRSGPLGSSPGNLTNVDGTVFFSTLGSTGAYSLWRTNGTAATTSQLAPLTQPGYPEAPSDFTAAGGVLLFVNDDGTTGPELWSSDGTPGGTGLVADTYPGTRDSIPFFWGRLGDVVLFNALTDETSIELWATDGTSGGTQLLKDINPGPVTTNPGPVVIIGGLAYFAAGDDAVSGDELYVTDGTPDGTRMVAELRPGKTGSNPGSFTAFGGRVYFQADDGVHGNELWSTDGTAAGTTLVKDINPGAAAGAAGGPMAVLNGRLYFPATTSDGGTELWSTDGTAAGTARVKDIRAGTASSAPANLAAINGTLFFQAADASGVELWKSDGTEAGTVLVKDIRPGTSDSRPGNFTLAGQTVYFTANDGVSGQELWKTDGTPEGTVLVRDISPGAGHASPSNIVVMNDRLFFLADDGTHGREVWSSGGTADTTSLLKDVNPGNNGAPVLFGMNAIGGRLFFAADDGTHSYELWSSDGTAAGTAMVQDLGPGLVPGAFGKVVEGPGGAVYFEGDDGVSGHEPYRLDDTFAPYVWSGVFDSKGQGPHALVLRFSEDVGDALTPDAVQVLDAATGEPVDVGAVSIDYDRATHAATITFPDLPGGRLPAGQYVAVVSADAIRDAAGNAAAEDYRLPFTVADARATVAGRWLFYNASSFDGADPAAGVSDDAAIAPDKQALLGALGTGTPENVSSYGRGINGVMIDFSNLPAGVTPTAADFEFSVGSGAAGGWLAGPAPSSVAVRRGAGAGGSDRVTLTWPDGAIRNAWLRVTVKPTANTGLAAPDVFAFGSLVGETGDATSPTRVSALDIAGVKRALNTSSTLTGRFDFNRDGRVNALDLSAARANVNHSLQPLAAPAAAARATVVAPTSALVLAPPRDSFLRDLLSVRQIVL